MKNLSALWLMPAVLVGVSLLAPGAPARAGSKSRLGLIPGPAEVERFDGEMELSDGAIIVVPEDAGDRWMSTALILSDKVMDRHGVMLEVVSDYEAGLTGVPNPDVDACAGNIVVGKVANLCRYGADPVTERGPAGEGYAITVRDAAMINAETAHGFHNAAMTLLQLIGGDETPVLPSCHIADRPRFEWRGMLLDSSRSFLPTDVIKRYIDLLSELKLNRFHWHIVDDQGWRIESKVFPDLHEVGGIVHNMSDKKLRALAKIKFDEDGKRESGSRFDSIAEAGDSRGYYTQEELKEIVAYAAERHVMIVPEIDVPGHTTAMIAAAATRYGPRSGWKPTTTSG